MPKYPQMKSLNKGLSCRINIFNTYPYFNKRVIMEWSERDGKSNVGVSRYHAALRAYRELVRYQWLPPKPGQTKI